MCQMKNKKEMMLLFQNTYFTPDPAHNNMIYDLSRWEQDPPVLMGAVEPDCRAISMFHLSLLLNAKEEALGRLNDY